MVLTPKLAPDPMTRPQPFMAPEHRPIAAGVTFNDVYPADNEFDLDDPDTSEWFKQPTEEVPLLVSPPPHVQEVYRSASNGAPMFAMGAVFVALAGAAAIIGAVMGPHVNNAPLAELDHAIQLPSITTEPEVVEPSASARSPSELPSARTPAVEQAVTKDVADIPVELTPEPVAALEEPVAPAASATRNPEPITASMPAPDKQRMVVRSEPVARPAPSTVGHVRIRKR